jgi:hypothetical protein
MHELLKVSSIPLDETYHIKVKIYHDQNTIEMNAIISLTLKDFDFS